MARAAPELVKSLQVSDYETSTDPQTTPSFDVEAGDFIVAWVCAENSDVPPFAVSGGSLTWTERETEDSNSNQRPMGRMYTATVDEAKSMTVTFDRESANTREWGWGLAVFRGSEGIGNTGSTNNTTGSGEPLLNLTTAQDASAVVALVVDWNVDTGESTWRTGAGAATEIAEHPPGGEYTVYAAVHEDAGEAALKALGMTSPDGQRYVILAVEVLGAEAEEAVEEEVEPGGATAGGVSPSTTAGGQSGGAGADGMQPSSSAAADPGGATGAGAEPGAETSGATPGSAAAGGGAPLPAASVPPGPTSAGGNAAEPRAGSPEPGGAIAGGEDPTAAAAGTSGGADAGGHPPTDSKAPGDAPDIELPTAAVVTAHSVSATVVALDASATVTDLAATAEVMTHASAAEISEAATTADISPHRAEAEIEPHSTIAIVDA